jgi:predicted alpha/beta-fold hydrolase
MLHSPIPPFRPHPLVRGGHAQTLAGAYLPGHRFVDRAQHRVVRLDDGDALVLHDDCPADWQPTHRSALLIHGLAGCHESGYMRRIAGKLNAQGVRAFRMDLRGCGAGVALARLPYHSGRSDDAAAALAAIAQMFPDSPTTLVGFSLGANITLKLLGELGESACGNLDSAMAVCPPTDLAACSRQISLPANRMYDRFFVGLLLEQLRARERLVRDAARVSFTRTPRTLWEFDDSFTAPICGFGTADNYYRAASSLPWIARIERPTLILASRDDPMIPPRALEQLQPPPSVRVHMAESGGHLGFVGRGGCDADRRWMDWRVVEWVTRQGVRGRLTDGAVLRQRV